MTEEKQVGKEEEKKEEKPKTDIDMFKDTVTDVQTRVKNLETALKNYTLAAKDFAAHETGKRHVEKTFYKSSECDSIDVVYDGLKVQFEKIADSGLDELKTRLDDMPVKAGEIDIELSNYSEASTEYRDLATNILHPVRANLQMLYNVISDYGPVVENAEEKSVAETYNTALSALVKELTDIENVIPALDDLMAQFRNKARQYEADIIRVYGAKYFDDETHAKEFGDFYFGLSKKVEEGE